MASSPAAAALLAEDDAARARAIDVSISCIVEAPAGAGKTELLIQRTLALLAHVDEPEAVVALTFTRAAAAEMRRRVLEAIAAAGPEPEPQHQRITWHLAAAVRLRDQNRGWNLAAAPSRLRIETLDALALRLVARMPWLSRFGAALAPTEHAAPLYLSAARAAFEAIETEAEGAEPARRLLRHLDADLEQAVKLLADLLEHRDQWLEWAPSARRAGEPMQPLLQREVEALVRSELEALVEALGDDGPRLAAAAELKALPGPIAARLPQWRQVFAAALTQGDTLRKKIAKTLPLSAEIVARLAAARKLPGGAPSSEVVDALVALLPLAAAELKRVFALRGACDFPEVTLAAVSALGDEAAPSALAFALDARLQHLLVDECQDTSHAQFALLHALTREWQPGDGRTLFLVGDPMQSVYRWRNARLELFLRAAAQERLGPVALTRLRLRRNFRSAPALVEWCNRNFAAAFPPVDDLETGAARFEASVAAHGSSGCVAMHVVEQASGDAGAEAQLIADLVVQDDSANSIAVLAPTRKDVAELGSALRSRSIPFEAVEIEPLAVAPVVSDLLALARALVDPADRVAWLAVLRAPWCGLTLADLHALCQGDQGEKYTPVPELWRKRRQRLSADGQTRAARVLATVEPAAREHGRTGLSALLPWCWARLGGTECARSANAGSEAAAFWRLLERMETESPVVDPDQLATECKSLYAPPHAARGSCRVQIMTVHNAKGLEFDTVILVGTARQARASEPHLLRWAERAAARPGSLGWLIAARPRRGNKEPLFEYLGERGKSERRHEDLRKFYVAATRAKSKLHLVARLCAKNDGDIAPPPSSLLAKIWETSGPEWAAAWNRRRVAPVASAAASAPPQLRPVRSGWQPPPSPPGVTWRGPRLAPPPSEWIAREFHAVGLGERALGTAVHSELQRIAESRRLELDSTRLRRALRAAGIPARAIDAAHREASAAIERTLADPRGRWLLGPQQEATCEWRLSGLVAGELLHATLDRSFIENGRRWIVDYKLAASPSADPGTFLAQQAALYRPQLERYARLATALDRRPVRCALYFPFWSGWLELDTHENPL